MQSGSLSKRYLGAVIQSVGLGTEDATRAAIVLALFVVLWLVEGWDSAFSGALVVSALVLAIRVVLGNL